MKLPTPPSRWTTPMVAFVPVSTQALTGFDFLAIYTFLSGLGRKTHRTQVLNGKTYQLAGFSSDRVASKLAIRRIRVANADIVDSLPVNQ